MGGAGVVRLSGTSRTAILYTVASDFSEGTVRLFALSGLALATVRNGLALARLRAAASVATGPTLADHRALALLGGSVRLAVPVGIKDSAGLVLARGVPWTRLAAGTARLEASTLAGRAYLAVPGSFRLSPSIPFAALNPVDIGRVYRGDTVVLPIWQARDGEGNVIDLAGATVWFTAKVDLETPDTAAPTIQVSTQDGGIVILDPQVGLYRITIDPTETQQLLDDTAFVFDVQVETPLPMTRTIRWGGLVVVRDVTRTPA